MTTQHRDYRLVDLLGYAEWSKRKLSEGIFPTLIAHLDATCMWLHPDETLSLNEDDFEELLEDLVAFLGKYSNK